MSGVAFGERSAGSPDQEEDRDRVDFQPLPEIVADPRARILLPFVVLAYIAFYLYRSFRHLTGTVFTPSTWASSTRVCGC